MDEGQEVAPGLLIPSCHAAKLFDPLPKAFAQIPVFVAVRVNDTLLLTGGQSWDHRLRPVFFDRRYEFLAVIALVRDPPRPLGLRRHRREQGWCMRDVGFLPRAEV